MSDRLPAPDFDAQNYARPNQNWICGHAAEGKPCRLGPDGKGHCQATAECTPVLEKKPGEEKGRWRCTRLGGPCESGPLPDGTCCRPVAKCAPVPTLRLRRGRFTRAILALTAAGLLIVLGNGGWRANFINPGRISDAHSSEAFALLNSATNHSSENCRACHVAGAKGPAGLLNVALNASPGLFEFEKLAAVQPAVMTAVDESCQKCHTHHAVHQPDAAREVSCSYCHTEHRGAKMSPPTDTQCDFCHGDASLMASSSAKGMSMSPEAFAKQVAQSQDAFPQPRPPGGFTEVIHHFATDHPEFRLIAENLKDPDTLKFNHELHMTGATIPRLPDGRKLDCAYCHQPDPAGDYMQPVKFESACRVCHSLQFDPDTPALTLPHGSPEFVSAFLHSLPKQYADYAERSGVTGAEEQKQFVQQKLSHLLAQVGSGEVLEQQVFFSTAVIGPPTEVGTVSGVTRAVFPGCAYCHEVKPTGHGVPEITKPVIFERWFSHADFTHAKHASMTCDKCHDVLHSTQTSDVLLPSKQTCVVCHSPRGGVASTCSTCHRYHAGQ
jgi:hypothetical protein